MNKKELKSNANVVGVAPLGDPHFGENTQTSPKECSNPNFKHQTLSSNVAITLIALVITIIVMLILVGVSVSIAINGGLFSTAKKAVTKTEEAKDSELRFMAMANAATHDKLWEYTSKDGKTIPIPAGFAPTEIEGETSTEEGFVIIDAEGNEFVWIPCTKTDYESATRDTSWPQYEYTNKTWTDGEEEVEGKKIKDIKSDSIDANGGFYVSRYEAGIPEEATEFYANKDGDAYKLDTEKNINKYKPVSKKGYPAWNYINQINAKIVSENMYSGMSYLIDSHAWNYICKNILADKAKENIITSSNWGNYYDNTMTKYENLEVIYALHTKENGKWKYATNYSKGIIPKGTAPSNEGMNGLELSTGASDDFRAYNIYDMAGNMWEWTTEIGTKANGSNPDTTYTVARGGGFDCNGSTHPVVRIESDYSINYCRFNIGFRVVLYL